MIFSENTVKGKWQELKGEIQKAWGLLTDDEIEKAKGNLNVLGGTVRQKYGEAETDFESKMNKIAERFNEPMDRTSEEMPRRPRAN